MPLQFFKWIFKIIFFCGFFFNAAFASKIKQEETQYYHFMKNNYYHLLKRQQLFMKWFTIEDIFQLRLTCRTFENLVKMNREKQDVETIFYIPIMKGLFQHGTMNSIKNESPSMFDERENQNFIRCFDDNKISRIFLLKNDGNVLIFEGFSFLGKRSIHKDTSIFKDKNIREIIKMEPLFQGIIYESDIYALGKNGSLYKFQSSGKWELQDENIIEHLVSENNLVYLTKDKTVKGINRLVTFNEKGLMLNVESLLTGNVKQIIHLKEIFVALKKNGNLVIFGDGREEKGKYFNFTAQENVRKIDKIKINETEDGFIAIPIKTDEPKIRF